MPLPAAPAGAMQFLMGGPTELIVARAVPSPDHLSGPLRDAAREVRRAVRTYDEIHGAGRKLVDRRREVHAADERNASRAVSAGKPMRAAKLDDHDAELADHADRLSAAAGAVVNAAHDLEAVPDDQWAKAAGKVAGQVAEHVGAAEDALATARGALKSVDGIAGVLAWTQRRARPHPTRAGCQVRHGCGNPGGGSNRCCGAEHHRALAVVPAETLRELRRWRMESGVPDDDQPIVGAMTAVVFYAWGRDRLKPAVKATVGRTDGVTAYLLRHTHASLLHYCGFTVPSAAARMGHAATEHLNTYAHVVKALESRPHYADLDALISAARADLAFPAGSRTAAESGDLRG